MDIQHSKLPIYIMIISATIGLFFVLYWIFSSSNTSFEQKPRATIDIVTDQDGLPNQCTQTIALLNCLVSKLEQTTDKEGLNQYYQRLISEWNIIVDPKELTTACEKQYNYIQSIQDKSYQTILQLCNE